MRIVPLSDHARDQLGAARQHLRTASAQQASWQQERRQAAGAVRVHIDADRWVYEKLDRWGNVVETGAATDRSGRSWARQVTDVAEDLGAWLRKNGHPVPIRTAVMLMHERAQIGRYARLTVDLVANHPDHLLGALATTGVVLGSAQRDEIVRLVERDHRFHEQRRRRRQGPGPAPGR